MRKGLADLFPHFDVELDESDRRTSLEKAKRLVCPVNGVLVDPHPLVFGESKGELLKRIQFSSRGSRKNKQTKRTLLSEIWEATHLTGGDYFSFVRTAGFLANACDYPSTVDDIGNRYYDRMNHATRMANNGILPAETTTRRMPEYVPGSTPSSYTWR